jgi:poly(beta-D-mannuronate) lyase
MRFVVGSVLAAVSAGAAVLPVATSSEAVAAVARARPGDEVVLADGEYRDFALKLAGRGTAAQPIVLRAERPGGAVLTGSPTIELTGEHLEVRGLAWRDCAFKAGIRGAVNFNGARHSRLTDCSFANSTLPGGAPLVAFRNRASDNRVDHCRFVATRYRAVVVVVDDAALKSGPPLRNRIDHNLFQDVPPLKANGAETIQIGQRAIPHSDLRPETIVEDNEFVRCDGEAEIISVKTSGNVIRHNVFRDCRGELVMRHGHENTLVGNRFEGGSGGIRLSGHGHVVTGNTMTRCRGTGVRLLFGTPDLRHPASYLPVYDCVITDNTITDCGDAGILVGAAKNARHVDQKWAGRPWHANAVMECTVAPHRNRIAGNTVTGRTGRLIRVDEAPANTIADNTLVERP